MTTTQLRKQIKAADSEATVSSDEPGWWTIRTKNNPDAIRNVLRALGMREVTMDIEGSRWDWVYAFYVTEGSQN